MDRKDDEEAFRCELLRQTEEFIVKYRPVIKSYIKKYTDFPEMEIDDICQDVSIYIYNRVPIKYRFNSLEGLFTYCKKVTCWYLKKLMWLNARTRQRRKNAVAKNGIYEPKSVFVDTHDMLDFYDLLDYLYKRARSSKEKTILTLIENNYTRVEIEKELGMSREGVRTYLKKFQTYLLEKEKSENV